MITAWTSRSLIASLLLLSACPGEDPPPAEDSSTGPGSTSTGDTPQTSTTALDSSTGPDVTSSTGPGVTSSTGPDDTSTGHNHTTDPDTTTTGPDDTTDTGSTGEASTGEASTGGSTTTGAMVDCTAGDGPDFVVGNNGAVDYVIDGVNDPGITVVRGCSYTFTVNTPGHPFFIKTMQVTGVGSAYNDGVANNGTQNGVITWDVPLGAPDALFYICQFHAGMTSTITVID